MFHHKKSSRQSFTGDENGEKIDSPNNPPDSTTPNDLSAGTASIMPIGSNYVLWVLEEFPRVCFKSPATGKFIGKSKRRGKHKEKRLSAVHVPTSFLNSQSSPAEIFQIIQVDQPGPDIVPFESGMKVAILTAKHEYWTAGMVSATAGPSLFLVKSDGSKPSENQIFTLELHENNSQLAFKSQYGTYVGVARKKKGHKVGHYLVAKQHLVSSTETFQLHVKCALASFGNVLCPVKTGNFSVLPNSKKSFDCILLEVSEKDCAFYTGLKKYVTADPSGQVTATALSKQAKENFRLVPHADGDWKYYIQTWYNGYIGTQDDKKTLVKLIGNCTEIDKATLFQLRPVAKSLSDEAKDEFQRKRTQSLTRRSSMDSPRQQRRPSQVGDGDDEDYEEVEEGPDYDKSDEKELKKHILNTSKNEIEKLSVIMQREATPSSLLESQLLPGEEIKYRMENIAHTLKGCALCGTLFITNFHVSYQARLVSQDTRTGDHVLTLAQNWRIGLGYISKVTIEEGDHSSGHFHLILQCKDYNIIQLSTITNYPQASEVLKTLQEVLEELCFTSDEKMWAPYVYKSALLEKDFGWSLYDAEAEYNRLGLGGDSRYKLYSNEGYSLCSTYPSKFVIPSAIDEETITAVARYRSKGRVPAIIWRRPTAPHSLLVRCSQPRTGLKRSTNAHDETMVEAIRVMTHDEVDKKNKLHITFMDARPFMNAMANQLSGAGYESTSNYKHSKRNFLGIANIHVMRDCLYKLQKLALGIDDGKKKQSAAQSEKVLDFQKYLSQRDETIAWLSHQTLILAACLKVIKKLEAGQSVIVHCSDGWDRTPQICALVELLMDPYYRTVQGFAVLIEKEWVSFGHKFMERIGHGPDYADKERSPIFLQWMETVWQVWLQYPLAFEFNDSYLAAIVAHSYSAMSGTFLTNSEKEREEGSMPELTSSLWTQLLSDEMLPGFLNPKYGQQQPPASSGGEEDKEKEGDRKKKEGTTLHKFATPTTILQPNPKQVQLWMQVHFPFFEFPKNS